MGYNARNDEIRDNVTRMQREWEAQPPNPKPGWKREDISTNTDSSSVCNRGTRASRFTTWTRALQD
jgi:hypothetical protein